MRQQFDHTVCCNLQVHQDKVKKPEFQHCSRPLALRFNIVSTWSNTEQKQGGGVIRACTQTFITDVTSSALVFNSSVRILIWEHVHKSAWMPLNPTNPAPVRLTGPIVLPEGDTRPASSRAPPPQRQAGNKCSIVHSARPSQSVQLLFRGCRSCLSRLLPSDKTLK